MRTTAVAVMAIIETDVLVNTALDPFIETANALVTEVCSLATKVDGTLRYDATRLELIERWLAAHFYAVFDLRRASERAGPVGESYQYKVGLNLAVTVYGQQAVLLDTGGGLARLSKQAEEGKLGRRVNITWLGTPYTPVTP